MRYNCKAVNADAQIQANRNTLNNLPTRFVWQCVWVPEKLGYEYRQFIVSSAA